MTNLFTNLSKNGSEPVNGPRMDRHYTENGPIHSRQLFAVLVMLLYLGVGNAWGAVNDLVYTLSFSQLSSGTNYNSYGGNHTITGANSKSWTVRGNQSAGTWLQVGGSSTSAADVIAIYNSSANITSVDVGKVVVTHSGTGGASLGKGNYASPTIYSVKLEVASNSDFSTITDTKTINNPSTSSDVEFSPTSGVWDKASYYRITYNYKSSNSSKNAYIKVSAVKFYEGASGCSNGTITYSAGSTTYTGGNAISGSHASDTKVCSTNLTLPGATFTTTGYTQDGWATSDGGSKVYNLSATNYSTEGDATLYPHWSANNYTVTWMSNGSQHTTTSVSYGSKPTFPSNPSSCDATSDTFYGWTTAAWTGTLDDVSAKTIYTSAASMPAVTGAVTYYAVFAKETTSATTYKKGTSADLTEGQTVVIVNKYYEVALSSEESGNGYDAVSLSISSNKFTSSNTSILWTVEVGSSGFYFKQGDNYINASPDDKGNHYLWFDEYSDEWTLTGSGPYVLYSTEDDGYQMQYYYSSDYFTTYTGTSGNAYNMDFYIPEVTYSKYLTNCCTNLGYINGSFFWTPLFEPLSPDNSWLKTHMEQVPYFLGPISYPAPPYIYYVYIP